MVAPGAASFLGPWGVSARACPSVACAWVGSLGRVAVSRPHSLTHPPTHPPPTAGFWPGRVQAGAGGRRGPAGLRGAAAGGRRQRRPGRREAARGDVSGGPAGSGRHFLYKGGRAGLRLPRAGVGLWAAGGGGGAVGGLSPWGAGLLAASPGPCLPFPVPGSRRDIGGAESWMCARARVRERKNGSAQTLRPGRGAGRGARRRGRGGRGAEPERARSCLRAARSVHGRPRGLSSRAVSALGRRRKCAFAGWRGSAGCGSGRRRRARGDAGRRCTGGGGAELRAALRTREQSAWGCPGEGCLRGQEEEGGRRERGSRLRTSPAPGKRLARSPLRCGRLSSSVA